jgi:hypothetical protein
MAATKPIKAVDLVRRIRDEQAKALAGKSDDEIIAFFRRAADQAHGLPRRIPAPAGPPAGEGHE